MRAVHVIQAILASVRNTPFFWQPLFKTHHVASMQIKPIDRSESAEVGCATSILHAFFNYPKTNHPLTSRVVFSAEPCIQSGGSIIHFRLPNIDLSNDGEQRLLEFLNQEQASFTHRITNINLGPDNRIEFPDFEHEESNEMRVVLKYIVFNTTHKDVRLTLQSPIHGTCSNPGRLKDLLEQLHPDKAALPGLADIISITSPVDFSQSSGVLHALDSRTKHIPQTLAEPPSSQPRIVIMPGLT